LQNHKRKAEERKDGQTDSLTVDRSSRKSPQFSRKTSPDCSRPRSAEELPAIIIIVIASSICEREREEEEEEFASAAIANKEENALLTQRGFWSG
jgi:hypothetical protein